MPCLCLTFSSGTGSCNTKKFHCNNLIYTIIILLYNNIIIVIKYTIIILLYYRPRMSMTTHRGIKNRFHIQNTIELGCRATAFVAERIVVAGLWKRRKLCHKTIDHFMYKTHKKPGVRIWGKPEVQAVRQACCVARQYCIILYMAFKKSPTLTI